MIVEEGPHLVAAGVLRRRGRGLLLHRSSGRRWYPDCWDLPGGHIEVGETSQAALHRELLEELGVDVVLTGAPFAHVIGEDIRMDVSLIDQWTGEPVNVDLDEHDALAWLNHHEMAGLKLADTRLPSLIEAALR